MFFLDQISNLLKIEKNEGRLVGLLFLYSFLVGMTRVFTFMPTQAIFLDRYSSSTLPWVYILAAVSTVAVGAIYLKLGNYISIPKLVLYNFILLGIITGLLWYSLTIKGMKWPALAAFSWFFLVFSLTSLGFWNIASKLFNVRQGKRLFALVTTGEVIAYAVGGSATGTLLKFLKTDQLLSISTASLFICAVLVWQFGKIYSEHFPSVQSQTVKVNKKNLKKTLKFDSYMVLLLIYFATSELMYFIVDNAFNAALEKNYSSAAEIASILGLYTSIAAITGLIVRSFLMGHLIGQFGIGIAILALPTVVLVGATLVVSAELFLLAPIVFWAMFSTRVLEKVFRGVQSSSLVTLYKPLMNRAVQTQNFMEGLAIPFAGGIAGLFLLFMHHFFVIDTVSLSYMLIVVCSLWLIISVMVHRNYVKLLPGTLSKSKLIESTDEDASQISFIKDHVDKSSMDWAITAAEGAINSNVIPALDYLESVEYEKYGDVLLPLTNHDDRNIRLYVLQEIDERRYLPALPFLKKRLEIENDPEVLSHLIRVAGSLGAEGVMIGREYLKYDNGDIIFGAIVGLLRSGHMGGIIRAGSVFIQKLESQNAEERAEAALILGEAEIQGFYQPVEELLKDKSLNVRKSALVAASRLGNPLLIPGILENINVPQLQDTVINALIPFGDSALPNVKEAFIKHKEQEEILTHIIRAIGFMRSDLACEFLTEHLEFPDEDIRHEIVLALESSAYSSPDEKRDYFINQIRDESQDLQWALIAIGDLEKEKDTETLVQALRIEEQQNQHRSFIFLSFLFERSLIRQVWDNFIFGDVHTKAYALELLDNLLPRKLRSTIFPMIEAKPDKERIKELLHGKKAEHLNYKERLREILEHSNQWTTTWSKCCALHTVALKKMDEFQEELRDLLYAPEEMVREMALWASIKIHNILDAEDAKKLFGIGFSSKKKEEAIQNGIPSLARSAWFSGIKEGKPVWTYGKNTSSISDEKNKENLKILSEDQNKSIGDLNDLISRITSKHYIPIVEKTNWFKSIDTFSDIGENIIANLINSMDDLFFNKGEFIIRQGETGNSMYVIYSGEVEILTNGKVISTEGPGHIFGERSVLVSEPREASVRTTQDSRIFCLEQEVLFMCFKENIELAKKLLAALFKELESHR